MFKVFVSMKQQLYLEFHQEDVSYQKSKRVNRKFSLQCTDNGLYESC